MILTFLIRSKLSSYLLIKSEAIILNEFVSRLVPLQAFAAPVIADESMKVVSVIIRAKFCVVRSIIKRNTVMVMVLISSGIGLVNVFFTNLISCTFQNCYTSISLTSKKIGVTIIAYPRAL